ncbi:uncharacterized protein F5Z01DRAFT_554235 [Emericellopsis atlantica]|uniref:Rhodopsin domain-containing protein n=1 Tax=Emericellopsis atlantica TaxID=2614577 RepID=A0A9P7ZQA8_9HYPO|nr:uncharacterized protein F5Z01DRAFT_554235 [Emericellopsis atlantica]KAG9255708.1 hypothetical protein F5Z01DRAFT_554235 [Emericellopsis atlantica]
MASSEVEGFTLLGLSIAIVLIRTLIRLRQVGIRNLAADDYFMLGALVPYIAETALAHDVVARYNGLTNSGLTDAERAALSPDSEEYAWRVGGSKVQVAGWCVYVSVIWFVKASLCTFYSRLTESVNGYRNRIISGYVLIGASYLALILSLLLSCQPFHHFWQIHPNPGNLCQPAISKVYVLLTVILNVLTDVYLILIPIPMLWSARLPTIKKLSLCVVFSGAIFVMTAGLLRGVLILKDPINGPKQGSSWAVRESFVAVATSNLPMIWGWLQTRLKPFLGSLLSSQSGKRREGPSAGSIMLANTNDNTGRGRCTTLVSVNRDADGSTHALRTDGQGMDYDGEHASGGGIKKEVAISVSSTLAQSTHSDSGKGASRKYNHNF